MQVLKRFLRYKIELNSDSLKSYPRARKLSHVRCTVQAANGTYSVVENNTSCQRDPHVWYQLTHESLFISLQD